MRVLVCSLLAIGTALGLTACGSDADEPLIGEGKVIPKTQFIVKADAICREQDDRLAREASKLARRQGGAADIARIAPILELNANTIRTEVSDIVELGRPSSDVDLLNRQLDQRRTMANILRSSADAAEQRDLEAFEAALAQLDDNRTSALAKQFGFEDCAQRQPLSELGAAGVAP